MRGFRDALGYSELFALGFHDVRTTWSNVVTKLPFYRAVASPSWGDIFSFSKVNHLPPSDSDHLPILLQASFVPIPKRHKNHRFKFESFWLQHSECDSLVVAQWASKEESLPFFSLTRKIARTRLALNIWQKENFCNHQHQMMNIRLQLEAFMDSPSTPDIQTEKTSLMTQPHSLLSQEEVFWKQCSKIS